MDNRELYARAEKLALAMNAAIRAADPEAPPNVVLTAIGILAGGTAMLTEDPAPAVDLAYALARSVLTGRETFEALLSRSQFAGPT